MKLKGKYQYPFTGFETILILFDTADTAAGQVDLQHEFLVKRTGDLFPRRMVQLIQRDLDVLRQWHPGRGNIKDPDVFFLMIGKQFFRFPDEC